MALAHSLGQRVVPYTLDQPGAVRRAAALGVDAVITDDPAMARSDPAPGVPAAPGDSGAAGKS